MTNVLGPLIRSKREQRGWSREELAHRSGYGVAVIQRAETGKGKPVTAKTLAELAQAVGLEAVRK